MQCVEQLVLEMESSHPELVSEMLKLTAAAFSIESDGAGRAARTGGIFWSPKVTQTLQHSDVLLQALVCEGVIVSQQKPVSWRLQVRWGFTG